jgi:hypothetical protein
MASPFITLKKKFLSSNRRKSKEDELEPSTMSIGTP